MRNAYEATRWIPQPPHIDSGWKIPHPRAFALPTSRQPANRKRTNSQATSIGSIRRLIQLDRKQNKQSCYHDAPHIGEFATRWVGFGGGRRARGLGMSKTLPNPVCTAWGGCQLSQKVCSFPCPPRPALRCVVVLVLVLAVSGADTVAVAAAIGGDVASSTAARSGPTGHRQGDALQQRSGNEHVHTDPRLVSLPSPCTVSSG